MKLNQLFALAAIVVSAGAIAQSQIGTIANVQGLVTMSDATSVTTVLPGSPVYDGASVVTSSTGFTTISVNGGCDIRLTPNQSVTVTKDKTCAALLAAVTPLPAGTAVAGVGGAGAGVGGAGVGGAGAGGASYLPLIGAAVIAAFIINDPLPFSGR